MKNDHTMSQDEIAVAIKSGNIQLVVASRVFDRAAEIGGNELLASDVISRALATHFTDVDPRTQIKDPKEYGGVTASRNAKIAISNLIENF